MGYRRTYSPHAEVLGVILIGMTQAIREMHSDISFILRRHHLDNINPDHWYRIVDLLDFFQTLDAMPSNKLNLAMAGHYLATALQVPASIITLHDYLEYSIPLHLAVHRGGDVGSILYQREGDVYEVVADVPYPTNYMYGVYHGFATRFLDRDFSIEIYIDQQQINTFVIRAYGPRRDIDRKSGGSCSLQPL